MAKSVRNVMSSVSKAQQLHGLTLDGIRREFMLAGYGVGKADKRTKELLASAQIQTDGRVDETGKMLFFCIYWPFAWEHADISMDMGRVGAIEYLDARHTMLRRLDGVINAWDLTISI